MTTMKRPTEKTVTVSMSLEDWNSMLCSLSTAYWHDWNQKYDSCARKTRQLKEAILHQIGAELDAAFFAEYEEDMQNTIEELEDKAARRAALNALMS